MSAASQWAPLETADLSDPAVSWNTAAVNEIRKIRTSDFKIIK